MDFFFFFFKTTSVVNNMQFLRPNKLRVQEVNALLRIILLAPAVGVCAEPAIQKLAGGLQSQGEQQGTRI